MKKSLVFLTLVTLLALSPAWADSDQRAEAPARFPDKSLYQVESSWTNDEGKQIKLAELAGRPQVLAMFFTRCKYACPLIVHDMKRIEEALPPQVRKHVGFTLVSFDTKRDTPEMLAGYRRIHGLSKERWTLLRGAPDDVLELAALLGLKFKEEEGGDFAHSNLITILNSGGEIVRQQFGLNQDISEAVRLIQDLPSK